jgi:hypothetical protein
MRKATATYVAPFGDSKVVEMGGVTFFDGKPVELNSHEHGNLISALEGNQHFDTKVEKEDDHPVPAAKKRGRPSAADKATAKAHADKTEADARAALDKAKEAKADLEAVNKADKADTKGAEPPLGHATPNEPATPVSSVFGPASQQNAQVNQRTPTPPVAPPAPIT